MNVLHIILATTKHISFLWVKKQLITYEKYKTTLKEIGILAVTYRFVVQNCYFYVFSFMIPYLFIFIF